MYGCTTDVAEPVKVGAELVPAGVRVWSFGWVTVCERVALGFPEVTALFVTV